MTSWMKNQRANFYNIASASVAATQDTFTDRLQNVCETASLLCNRFMDNIGNGQERLKDIRDKK